MAVVQYILSLRDLLTDKVKKANDEVNKFEGGVRRAQGAVSSFGTAIGVAFGAAAVVGFGQKMLQAGTQVESALIGLETLLKDKAAAQGVINQTMEDAARTPFGFEGLLAANKALIGAGVSAQGARTDVLNLANAIAATGGGDDELQRMVVNLQQIRNTGKATALDIKQFAYAGVNIYKVLADATGQPIEKVKDMEVTYDQLTFALQKAHEAGGIYAGGLEKMAGTTAVQISNLGDSVFQFSVQMFNDLKPAIDSVVSGLSTFVGYLRDGWNWIVQNSTEIKKWAMIIGAAASPIIITSVATYGLSLAAGVLTAALTGVAAVMTFIAANPITVALMAVAGAVMYCYQHFAKFRAVLWGVWYTVKEFAQLVKDSFMGLWHIIHGIFTMDASEIKLGGTMQASAMFNAGQRLGSAFKKGYDDGLKDFADSQKAKTTNAPQTATTPGKGGTTKTQPTPAASQTKGATGQKAVTINVTIGNLVKDLKVETKNIYEGAGKVRELVAQALVSATNDSQIIAGQ